MIGKKCVDHFTEEAAKCDHLKARESYNIIWIITISKSIPINYFINCKLAFCQVDYKEQVITLSVKTLSIFHCDLTFLLITTVLKMINIAQVLKAFFTFGCGFEMFASYY